MKNAITGDTAQTFQRKFQELALAIRVEQRYTKDQILALYLNDVYFGNGIYGIGTAADFYFHVPASHLKLTQSAMLAGMIRSPNYYDPLAHPVKARIRRNVVLDRLADLGWVPQERIDRAKASPLGLAPDIGTLKLRQPPFFVRYITNQIVADTDGEFDAFGLTESARRRRLYEGGLRITTTLDPDWQAAAQSVATRAVSGIGLEPQLLANAGHGDRVRRQRDGRHPHDAVRSQLPEGPVEPGRRAAPTGLGVQALHARRRVPRRDPSRFRVFDQITALSP